MELYVLLAILRISCSKKIPVELDDRLSEISKDIPVCVISSKDFGFLYDKIRFARIVSCIMGIETINLKSQVGDELMLSPTCDSNDSFETHLITDIDILNR